MLDSAVHHDYSYTMQRRLILKDAVALDALDRIVAARGGSPVGVLRALVAHADPDGATLGTGAEAGGGAGGAKVAAVLVALDALVGPVAVTSATLLARAGGGGVALRDVLEAAGAGPRVLHTAQTLGIYLRSLRGVVAGGRRLTVSRDRTGVALWRVEEVASAGGEEVARG